MSPAYNHPEGCLCPDCYEFDVVENTALGGEGSEDNEIEDVEEESDEL